MYKYVKNIDDNGKCLYVGLGTDIDYYKNNGFVRKDVEQSEVDGFWYLSSKCPHYTDEEKLANAKTAKLEELSRISHQYSAYECPVDMYIVSSTGFKVDADVCSQTNMQGLVLMLEPGQTTQYKDFNNEFQEVSREQLETMIVECEQNGLNLYQQKFEYESQINAAQSIEELDAIELVFEMMDFSKE